MAEFVRSSLARAIMPSYLFGASRLFRLGGCGLVVVIPFSFFLHPGPAGVIIGRFLEVRPHDFADEDWVVAGKFRDWVVRSVFEFGIHTALKLLDICLLPIDAQLITDFLGFVRRERFAFCLCHYIP